MRAAKLRGEQRSGRGPEDLVTRGMKPNRRSHKGRNSHVGDWRRYLSFLQKNQLRTRCLRCGHVCGKAPRAAVPPGLCAYSGETSA